MLATSGYPITTLLSRGTILLTAQRNFSVKCLLRMITPKNWLCPQLRQHSRLRTRLNPAWLDKEWWLGDPQ